RWKPKPVSDFRWLPVLVRKALGEPGSMREPVLVVTGCTRPYCSCQPRCAPARSVSPVAVKMLRYSRRCCQASSGVAQLRFATLCAFVKWQLRAFIAAKQLISKKTLCRVMARFSHSFVLSFFLRPQEK